MSECVLRSSRTLFAAEFRAQNIAGPFFYKTSQAPGYRLGIASMLVCNCLEVLILFGLRIVLSRANAKRDKLAAEMVGDGKSEAVPHINETAFNDTTDMMNPKCVPRSSCS